MKTSTILLLVLGYLVYSNMGASSTSNVPKAAAPQPQSGGGDTFNQVMAVIAAGAKAVNTYIANDRSAPANTTNVTSM